MSSVELKADHDKIEQQLYALQAERDEAIRQTREKYDAQLRDLRDQARVAQKGYCDAQAAEALVGQADAEATARLLGLTLPEPAAPESPSG